MPSLYNRRTNRLKWTEERLIELRDLAKVMTIEQAAKKTGRTIASIRTKSTIHVIKWTIKE